jgi:glycosyltransferase involved in cell wall biosynthesis
VRICFLASAIPSKADAYDGDYILRHAICISQSHEVSLFYAMETELCTEIQLETEQYNERLTIYRYYLPAKNKHWLQKRTYYKTLIRGVLDQGRFDLIHAQIHWRAGYLASQLSKKMGIPFVLSEHLGYFNTKFYSTNSVNQYFWLKKYLVKQTLRNASLVLPVSDTLGKWIQAFEPKSKISTVSNVVFEDQFYYTDPIQAPFTFIHASGLSAEKNLKVMLDAILILAKEGLLFKFHFIAPQLKQIEDFKIQNRLEEIIENKGMITHEEMATVFQASHCNVLVSSSETQGCVIIESLSCGRPNIVSNIETFHEMINRSNGLISDLGDPISLANCMKSMIENYADYDLRSISKQAHSKYGAKHIASLFTQVYHSVLREKSQG